MSLPTFLGLLPTSATPLLLVLEGGAQLGGRDGIDLTRYLLVCGGLILLVGGLGWAVRRVLGRALRGRATRRSMQVMDVLPLGGKQRLAVVRCYDRTYLLGLGDKEVRLVSELDAVLEPQAPHRTSVESRSFADLIRRAEPAAPRPRADEQSDEQSDELVPAAPRRLAPEGLIG